MAARAAATRRLPTLLSLGGRLRSDKCFLGQSIRPISQAATSDRIYGAPKKQRKLGHSIYIQNLPLDQSIVEMEAEFAKFGTIKQSMVEINRKEQRRFCVGVVEFQEFSSMQSAIMASPITIRGHRYTVEINRDKHFVEVPEFPVD